MTCPRRLFSFSVFIIFALFPSGTIAANSTTPCNKTPNYAAGEKSINEAFCQLLQRCPNNVWEWSVKFQDYTEHMREIVEEIALSEEFHSKNLANQSNVIVILYQKLLARNPDPKSATLWYIKLKNHGWRKVVKGLINSQEYEDKFGTRKVPNEGVLQCCC